MSVTSSVGLFSGIDTGSIIQQLLALEARPRDQAIARITQLNFTQAAYLDINSQLSNLRTESRKFRISNNFLQSSATSSNESVLTATAGNRAGVGNYTFIVDRLVTTQQQLSRGFADRDSSAINAGTFTFESAEANLVRDAGLSELNGGSGVRRGEIIVSTSDGSSETVDLSRAASVQDVLDEINGSGLSLEARVVNGAIEIEDLSGGGGAATVANATGSFAATDLGLTGAAGATTSGGTLEGANVYYLTDTTALSSLNDGTGIERTRAVGTAAADFSISINGEASVKIFLGEETETVDDETTVTQASAGTIGDVIDIINTKLADAGYSEVTASLKSDGTGIQLVDSLGRTIDVLERGESTVGDGNATGSTASDLGIAGSATSSLVGSTIFGGLNSTLLNSLNGGNGIAGDGVLDITFRDGTTQSLDVSSFLQGDLSGLLDYIESETGGKLEASYASSGTGFTLTDTTGSTASNLIITGTGGSDTASSLGIATDVAGVNADSVSSGNLERRYISLATLATDLNDGRGISTGTFSISDASGAQAEISIGTGEETVAHILDRINSAGLDISARLNDGGDGIIIEDTSGLGAAGQAISIEDITGNAARDLGIEGTAAGNDADNFIDGSAELSLTFESTDTLEDIVNTINDEGRFVSAAIINDGSGANPFRLNFTARGSGTDGRFLVDTGSFDLGLTTLSEGDDARVFFGSSNPADALVLTSSSNTLDDVISGVSIDLKTTSDEPVTLNVSRDVAGIVEDVQGLVDALNTVVERIDFQTRFNSDTEERGPLLGDGTVIGLRNAVFRTLTSEAQSLSTQFTRFTDIGISVGSGGTIEFDQESFRAAYEQDPAAVQALFDTYEFDPNGGAQDFGEGITVTGGTEDNTTFSALGVAGLFENLADNYINSVDGILTARNESIQSQIDLQESRIESLNAGLAAREQVLARQFLAMEQAIGQLQGQSAALSQIQLIG